MVYLRARLFGIKISQGKNPEWNNQLDESHWISWSFPTCQKRLNGQWPSLPIKHEPCGSSQIHFGVPYFFVNDGQGDNVHIRNNRSGTFTTTWATFPLLPSGCAGALGPEDGTWWEFWSLESRDAKIGCCFQHQSRSCQWSQLLDAFGLIMQKNRWGMAFTRRLWCRPSTCPNRRNWPWKTSCILAAEPIATPWGASWLRGVSQSPWGLVRSLVATRLGGFNQQP